jgi:hypothetical protein
VNYAAFADLFGEDTSAGQLPQYVRLFFLNGGTDCWVMRTAHLPAASSVTLRNEAGSADALILTAKDQGADGENIRVSVSYSGAQPEVTFNMDLFAWELQGGQRVRARQESWKNLSMNPTSAGFAPTFLTQNSKLVDATLPGASAALVQGISQSGHPVQHTNVLANMRAAWGALIGNGAGVRNHFLLSVDGSPFLEINLNNPVLDVSAVSNAAPGFLTNLANEIRGRIINQFAAQGFPGLTIDVAIITGPTPTPSLPGTQTSLLQISSLNNGDVFIRPATTDDVAVRLMLGAEQGGLEISAFSARRPAPNGISLSMSRATLTGPPPNPPNQEWNPTVWFALANLTQNAFTPLANGITLDQFQNPPLVGTVPFLVRFTGANDVVTTTGADLFYRDANAGSLNDNDDGLREKLQRMAAAINARASAEPLFRWSASVAGTRLNIVPTDLVDDNFLSPAFAVTGFPAGNFLNNVKVYTLGAGGLGIGRQVAGTVGSNGTAPLAADYDAAYPIIDREVDLFNLMVLPPVTMSGAVPVENLYANASVFCQQRRAFLLMDRPTGWTSPQIAIAGLTALRTGLVKDYSAVFYPRIRIRQNGLEQEIGPAGALAGLFARIDGTRGVWKAPAGTEADLRGIVGLERSLSDLENGTLNPRAINALRVFPSGIVSWGARTNQGDDNTPHDYKYIPIRRLALFIEESLYRGLKWVVFEPNDEPLYAQIRLNVGAFMNNLFRQGAFQGQKPRDAYFVKCDTETTTQNDRNLGIVNIWVGFAPLKPAEFVILYLQQMAGQIET